MKLKRYMFQNLVVLHLTKLHETYFGWVNQNSFNPNYGLLSDLPMDYLAVTHKLEQLEKAKKFYTLVLKAINEQANKVTSEPIIVRDIEAQGEIHIHTDGEVFMIVFGGHLLYALAEQLDVDEELSTEEKIAKRRELFLGLSPHEKITLMLSLIDREINATKEYLNFICEEIEINWP